MTVDTSQLNCAVKETVHQSTDSDASTAALVRGSERLFGERCRGDGNDDDGKTVQWQLNKAHYVNVKQAMSATEGLKFKGNTISRGCVGASLWVGLRYEYRRPFKYTRAVRRMHIRYGKFCAKMWHNIIQMNEKVGFWNPDRWHSRNPVSFNPRRFPFHQQLYNEVQNRLHRSKISKFAQNGSMLDNWLRKSNWVQIPENVRPRALTRYILRMANGPWRNHLHGNGIHFE